MAHLSIANREREREKEFPSVALQKNERKANSSHKNNEHHLIKEAWGKFRSSAKSLFSSAYNPNASGGQ